MVPLPAVAGLLSGHEKRDKNKLEISEQEENWVCPKELNTSNQQVVVNIAMPFLSTNCLSFLPDVVVVSGIRRERW